MKVFHQHFIEMLAALQSMNPTPRSEGGVVYSRVNVCARPDDSCKRSAACSFCHGKELCSRESIIFRGVSSRFCSRIWQRGGYPQLLTRGKGHRADGPMIWRIWRFDLLKVCVVS